MMDKAIDAVCPRCGGAVPDEENVGKHPGAMSRVADVEICSLCGEDEALAALFTEGAFSGLVPQDEWPISRKDVEDRMKPLDETRAAEKRNEEVLRAHGILGHH